MHATLTAPIDRVWLAHVYPSARLAGYKVPKTVRVIDAIPLSPVGKILRRALREPLWR